MIKENFIKHDAMTYLMSIDPNTTAHWGVMNVHDMIEHMSDSFRIANGKDIHATILTDSDKLPRMHEFILSDKPMRENTKNTLMADQAPPHRHQELSDAYHELKIEINDFILCFENQPNKTIRNPFFGDLNYELWCALLYKHLLHHLRQFGINII